MPGRLRTLLAANLPALYAIEAALVGLFFVQALRFLIGTVYAHAGSASLYPLLDLARVDPNLPGLVEPSTVNGELTFLAYMLALPLLILFIGRVRLLIVIAVALAAVGRYLMADNPDVSPVVSGAMTVGGGLVYVTLLVRHRARTLPLMMVLALAADQLLRAAGDTLDPSWSIDYAPTQLVLSVSVVVLAAIIGITYELEARRQRDDDSISADRGIMTVWGGIGLGALLFLQLSVLAMPNVVAARTGTDYALIVPLLLVATLLPLMPAVRSQARRLLGLFDSSVRGWVWMLLVMLLIVLGARLGGWIAAGALVAAQLAASLWWWWLVRPQAGRERNFAALWIVLGTVIFGVLVVFDIFTYEYAFVRDFGPDLNFLNPIIPPLLRGFREMGLAVLLLAAFLAALSMVQMRRRIGWSGGSVVQSLAALVLVGGAAVGGAMLAQPPVVTGFTNLETVRVGTYNIHAGYNEFFHFDLEAQAQTIQQSGANIVLLQEVEAGKLTSFGVDQALWLARRLGMDMRFLPTIEGLQGLAVLSNIEIVFDDGVLLDSVGSQTGLQRVQVRPDAGVITIYNTWLDPLLVSGSTSDLTGIEQSQQAQLSQVFGIISAHHQPEGQLGRTVIGGTFNNVPDSDLIQRMRESGFVDHFAGQQLDITATFWRTDARARLDYIWTTPSLQAVGWGVIDSRASDHRLAVIEVALR